MSCMLILRFARNDTKGTPHYTKRHLHDTKRTPHYKRGAQGERGAETGHMIEVDKIQNSFYITNVVNRGGISNLFDYICAPEADVCVLPEVLLTAGRAATLPKLP